MIRHQVSCREFYTILINIKKLFIGTIVGMILVTLRSLIGVSYETDFIKDFGSNENNKSELIKFALPANRLIKPVRERIQFLYGTLGNIDLLVYALRVAYVPMATL